MQKSTPRSAFLASIYLLVFGFAYLLLISCANEMAPSGGKRDTEPPKLKAAEPANKTTNFTGNKIKLKFDEYIEQTGGFTRTLISPPLLVRPKFRVSGKTLTVVLPDGLAPSTTYTINFADDLKDLNEGNPMKNFIYVFSTGDKIDSQSVSGKVTDAFSGEPLENALVLLHPRDSTDGFKRNRPTYFAIADKAGNYEINYIKEGEYEVFGLIDQNLNYTYDQPNEKIAFQTEKVNLFDSLPPQIALNFFQEESNKQKLIEKSFVEPGHLLLVYTSPIKTISIKSNLDSAGVFAYLSKEKDSLHFWYANPFEKQAELQLTVNDTLFDTARIKLNPPKPDTTYQGGVKPLHVDYQQVKSSVRGSKEQISLSQELYGSFKIFFSRPCIGITDSTATIFATNDTTKSAIATKVTIDANTKLFAEIEFPKEEETSYTIKIPAGYFTDIFGAKNDSATFHLLTKKKGDYGVLKLKIEAATDEYKIVELISAKTNEVAETIYLSSAGTRTYNFKNLRAENYFIKVIDDANKNGKWDTGNFAEKAQPEKITFYKNLPELKGGWEAEFELKLQ